MKIRKLDADAITETVGHGYVREQKYTLIERKRTDDVFTSGETDFVEFVRVYAKRMGGVRWIRAKNSRAVTTEQSLIYAARSAAGARRDKPIIHRIP
jgi:hypothetical protein